MAQTREPACPTNGDPVDRLSFLFRGRTLGEILHPVPGRRNQLTWTPRDSLLCRQYLARLRLDHAAIDLLPMDDLARSLDIPSVGGDGTGGELLTREEWAAIAAKMLASLHYILSITTRQGKLVDRWDPVLGRRTLMWPDKLRAEWMRPVELKGDAVDPGVAPQEAGPEQEHQNINDRHHQPLSRPEAQQQSPQPQEQQSPQQSVQHQEPSSPNTPPRSVKGSHALSDAAALTPPPTQHRERERNSPPPPPLPTRGSRIDFVWSPPESPHTPSPLQPGMRPLLSPSPPDTSQMQARPSFVQFGVPPRACRISGGLREALSTLGRRNARLSEIARRGDETCVRLNKIAIRSPASTASLCRMAVFQWTQQAWVLTTPGPGHSYKPRLDLTKATETREAIKFLDELMQEYKRAEREAEAAAASLVALMRRLGQLAGVGNVEQLLWVVNDLM